MAERIEVDAIIKAISEGFDKVGQDFTKLARESQKAGDAVKGAGDDADNAVTSLDKLSNISRESALRLAALDARASALNTQMRKLAREVEQGNADVDAATDAYNDLQRELDQTYDAMRDVEREARKLDDSIEDVGDGSSDAKLGIIALNQGVELLQMAFSQSREAAREVYETLQEGAQIEAAALTFDSLASSIGTTADVMLNELQVATNGMISDLELMGAANQFTAMGLATTSGEAAKLAQIGSTLGAAFRGDATAGMEEFALLLANQSIPRLDSFGISAGAVRSRIQELQEETPGLSRETAFMTAVMEQAEITMGKLGDQSTNAAAEMARLEASAQNAGNALKREFAEGLTPTLKAINDLTTGTRNAGFAFDDFVASLSTGISGALSGGVNTLEELLTLVLAFDNLGDFSLDNLRNARNLTEGIGDELERLSRIGNVQQGPLTREQAEAMADLADETAAVAEETTEVNNEWRESVRQQQLLASQQQGLNRAMEQGVGAVGDTRDGWETYNEQVEETTDTVEENTAALRRAEVQFNNNRDRLIELKAEAERLEQQFADLTTELLNNATASGEYDAATVTAATDTSTLAGIMRDSAAAAGLDAEGRALLAVATGELTTAQAAAVLEAAALQAKARELGEAIAAGTITITEAVSELNNLQASFNAIDTLTARSEIDQLEAALNQIDGRTVRVTVSVDQQGGTTVQQGGQGPGLSEFMSGGFTGNVATNQVAGVVHGQEFVLNAAATRRLGVGNLNALNNGGGLAGVTINGGISIMLANPINATPDQIGTSVANKIGQRLNRG